MSWKRQRTSQSIEVDADLDDFSEEQLLQALIDAKWLSEDEAEAIQKRAAKVAAKHFTFGHTDTEELDEAKDCLRRGNRTEAVIHLERFLGREWMGVLA